MAWSVNQSTAVVKSDQSSGGTAQSVSWHLPCQEQEGGRRGEKREKEREHERVGRRKNPAAFAPEPRAAFKGVGGRRGEGEAGRLLAPSVHVFCIPALIFTQSEAGVLSVQIKTRGGAFWDAML